MEIGCQIFLTASATQPARNLHLLTCEIGTIPASLEDVLKYMTSAIVPKQQDTRDN